ncbi:ATP-binding cassette domain-containing protein [Croceicoccus naphthovorans]|uniref:Molybdenum ABC transporter ATP-binding protein n=1 Tax=Croceicoccus naphthovorans TaxID=1348774 RepID=A0A0G3XE77_9SPHN|nr:ATP-binding cassette domain-containing protein [Croceicoccus naphthovorans]AKM09502.1 molybdenum ABC transporter ATP-binding protein [Croceicoccus naphthovorans]MBB3989765.1 molybdate transport system ATP-binding protein [Croceicoccus naphthovorans]
MSFDVDIAVRRGRRRIEVRFKAEGGLVALFGPSGAGKTSVLDAVAGLLRPERGRIAVEGTVLFDGSAKIDLRPQDRACGYVFQEGRLFPHMTVRENLMFGQRRAGMGRVLPGFDETLRFLGIAELLDRAPRTLSGGEAQRVAIGRALLSGPQFLLMDEPLSSIDSRRRDEIMIMIERIRDEMRVPILYVSHDRSEVDRLAESVVAIG